MQACVDVKRRTINSKVVQFVQVEIVISRYQAAGELTEVECSRRKKVAADIILTFCLEVHRHRMVSFNHLFLLNDAAEGKER